jgi:alkylation response protein AidB-like acyl-CoA dehydrogenase
MDFELDDEQLELQRVIRDLVDRDCPPSLVRGVVEEREEAREAADSLWKSLVGMELTGLTVAADLGGTGATAVELAIVLEELGRGADPTPFLATSSQFVPLVREAFGERGAASLEAVCAGATGAVAFAEGDVRAERADDGWTLTGRTRHVMDADRADEVAVVASSGDDLGVFLVAGADLAVDRTPTFDASLHVCAVEIDAAAVSADRAVVGPAVRDAVTRARQEAVTGLAAATVGACEHILDLALDHVRTRKQFGVPIGSFQAVKHLAVDMFVAIQRARALVHFAALTIAEDDDRRAVAASMAKAGAGDAQRLAARHGIQLFGGLGYTWENDLQLFVRRAIAGELLLGTSTEHRAVVAGALLADPTEGGR